MKSNLYATRAGCTVPPPSSWPWFRFGSVEMPPTCRYTLERSQLSALEAFGRHTKGDWGDVPPEVMERNDQALVGGHDRLISAYKLSETITIWIITESDRSRTTILLPQEDGATDVC